LRQEACFYALPELVAAVDEVEQREKACEEDRRYRDAAAADHLRAVSLAMRDAEAALEPIQREWDEVGEALHELQMRWVQWEGGLDGAADVDDLPQELRDEMAGMPPPVMLHEAQRRVHEMEDRITELERKSDEIREPFYAALERVKQTRVARLCALGMGLAEAEAQLKALYPTPQVEGAGEMQE
jgi:chromosome segregation ATPase